VDKKVSETTSWSEKNNEPTERGKKGIGVSFSVN
jgi:hypothetical protein